jgi:ketosteroid isomerase-like protein
VSQENLNLVRSIYVDWERGDYGSARWAHPDIEFVTADGPEPGSSTGLTHMAAALRDFLTAWKDARAEAAEYREIDDERVLVLVILSGRGKTSGLELARFHSKAAFLFTVRGEKVVRLVRYFDRDRAFADLGLTA